MSISVLMFSLFGASTLHAQITTENGKTEIKDQSTTYIYQVEKEDETASSPVAFACTGKKSGQYITYASGTLQLQDGIRGNGELFMIEKKFNRRVAIACIGDKKGMYLSHAFGKLTLQNGYKGLGEEWILTPSSKTKYKIEATGDEQGYLLSSNTGYRGVLYMTDKEDGDATNWQLEVKGLTSTGRLDQPLPDGFTVCATEGQTVEFNKPVDVAYGADGKFIIKKNVTGKVTFSPDFFGSDPAFGVVKSGYSKNSAATPESLGFKLSGGEGKSRIFNKAVDVAYGADGKYVYMYNVMGKITFSAEFFGSDPNPGVKKSGYVKDADPAAGKPTIMSPAFKAFGN